MHLQMLPGALYSVRGQHIFRNRNEGRAIPFLNAAREPMVTAFFEIYCLCNQEERQAFFAQRPQEEAPEQLRIPQAGRSVDGPGRWRQRGSLGRLDSASRFEWIANEAAHA